LSCFETGLGVTVLGIGADLSNPVSCWPNNTTVFPYTKDFPGSAIAEEREKKCQMESSKDLKLLILSSRRQILNDLQNV
jgi:hypothetical protein